MTKRLFISLFVVLCGFARSGLCLSQNYIKVDLIDKEISFVDFQLGDYVIDGTFSFTMDSEGSSLIFGLKGENVRFNNFNIPWLDIQLISREGLIFVERLALPKFIAKGRISLDNGDVALSIEGKWSEYSKLLEGQINTKVKIWGKIGDFFTSGYLTVQNGKYKGNEFSKLRLDFLGKPPVFNITDSEIVFKGGSIFEIEGVLDLRDFSNVMPDAEFKAQKIVVDEWQILSDENENITLRKDLDDKLGVLLGLDRSESSVRSPGTELRYNLQDDKFLRLKMDERKTTFRFEKRRDF